MNLSAALLDPVVSAAGLLVWVCAALLTRKAQVDRPVGPAPLVDARAARRALAVCATGLVVAAAQLLSAAAHAAGSGVAAGGAALLAPGAWPALAAALTGALLVAARTLGPLRRMASGYPVTDVAGYRELHAALGAAVVSGIVAALVAVVGAGLVPNGGARGPYLAPVVVVAGTVLGANALLRRGPQLLPA